MGIILRLLREEELAIRLMLLPARCLRGERCIHTLRMRQLKSPIHLIRRDMIETLTLIPLRQRFPILLRSLQQRKRAHDVGARERERVLDRAVHMALRSEMDDTVNLILTDHAAHLIKISDIRPHESIVRSSLDILQISEITRIRQLIKIHDMIVRILVHKKPDNMGADKPRPPGDQYIPHKKLSKLKKKK